MKIGKVAGLVAILLFVVAGVYLSDGPRQSPEANDVGLRESFVSVSCPGSELWYSLSQKNKRVVSESIVNPGAREKIILVKDCLEFDTSEIEEEIRNEAYKECQGENIPRAFCNGKDCNLAEERIECSSKTRVLRTSYIQNGGQGECGEFNSGEEDVVACCILEVEAFAEGGWKFSC
ncbi:hypothetical protein CO038_02540 [Candidatus Pacearchaeota archaeon CG_4_9_14_0_2_um_filter_39_13]|nr:hypothetical protein [Candidatus Pacearchaeota archaeon]OIO43555.1 MAG: hypothetical protein AUJ64_02060 [Candidatus Pacearchaeota archaeon CG1_02_39_14]PJC44662.1 MAG: hypothetical protein CO038_02540 [Candidatus Pacearchaeota archaeon CG_4_9_14_0_2_um_filter_39_13]